MSPYGDDLYGDGLYGDSGVAEESTTPEVSVASKSPGLGKIVRLYYDPQYPLAKICFDYAPDEAVTFHVRTEKPLLSLASLDTVIDLPLEYKEALMYNLAVRVHTEEDTILSQIAVDIANVSKNTIEVLRAVDRLVRQPEIESRYLSYTAALRRPVNLEEYA
jgi:hypothetical protein